MSSGSYTRALLGAAALCAAGAPVAHADVQTLGSDLKADATITRATQADGIYWPTSVKGSDPRLPASGQIVEVRVKGTSPKEAQARNPPLNSVHIQNMRAVDGGLLQTVLTAGPFDIPSQGDPNQISTFRPVNLCVVKGDYVDFNESGGWGWNPAAPDNFDGNLYPNGQPHIYKDGAPFQIFGSVPRSTTAFYSGDGTTGQPLSSSTGPLAGVMQDTEMLMQYKLATGSDVGGACAYYLQHPNADPRKGRTAKDYIDSLPPPPPPVVKPPTAHPMLIWSVLLQVKRSRAYAPRVFCPRGAACTGTAVLTAKGTSTPPVAFTVPANQASRIALKLPRSFYRWLRIARNHRLKVTLAVTSQYGVATKAFKLWG